MKKLFAAILTVLLAGILSISFVGCSQGSPVKLVEVDLTDEQYGFCVRQDENGDKLLESINNIIAKMKGEGIDGVTINSLFEAEVNKTAQHIGEVKTTSTNRAEEFVVATNSGFRPFEYKVGAYFAGIDMQMAKIIAKELGKTLVILDMNFNSIVASVQNGDADVGMAGMTITEEKKENVQFSDSYYTASQWIAVREDDTTFDNCTTRAEVEEVLKGLEGKKAQAAAGYTGYTYISQFKNLSLTSQNDIGVSVRELSQGKTDIVVGDKYTIAEMVYSVNAEL